MKTTLIILLVGFLVFGCSKKHTTPSLKAIDVVEAGRDLNWIGGYVLHVAKRERGSIQGVRLVWKNPEGKEMTVTAEKGMISEGLGRNSVKLVLYDAHCQTRIAGETCRQQWYIS